MANWEEDVFSGQVGDLAGDLAGDAVADDGGFGAATDLELLQSSCVHATAPFDLFAQDPA